MSIHCRYGVSLVLKSINNFCAREEVADMKDLQEGVGEAGVSIVLLLLTHSALPPCRRHISLITLLLDVFPTSLERAFSLPASAGYHPPRVWTQEPALLEPALVGGPGYQPPTSKLLH